MAKTSKIVIKEIEKGKKTVKKKKANAGIDKIVAKMKQIQKEYEWVETYYNRMLTKGNQDGGPLDASDDYYNAIKDAKTRAGKRAGYCVNRINNLNNLYHQDIGDEAQYLAKRLAEVEAQLAKVQKEKTEDTDAA